MKTRYTHLVDLKKNLVEKSERVLQKANTDLNSATVALQSSYMTLENLDSPTNGKMEKFLASRTLLDSARESINKNKEWTTFAKKQIELAKGQLKLDMIEYEKFKYLELIETNKMLKKVKDAEVKELDEVALITFVRKAI